jgi:hypothetical protein
MTTFRKDVPDEIHDGTALRRARRTWRFWIVVTATALSIVCCIAIVIVSFEVILLMGNDADARAMARILVSRIRSRDPAFKGVVENVSFWQNHRPASATALERLWNRQYPAIVGTVKSEAELDALRDLIRVVCEEHHYDAELVWAPVRVEDR